MNYAKAFRTIRATHGISQKEFADILEVDPSYISRIESSDKIRSEQTDGRVPSTKLLEKISSSFNIPFYLIALLASEGNDLKGIPKAKTDELAASLLELLVNTKNNV